MISALHSQNSITDSLNALLPTIQDDSIKVETYMALSKAFYFGEKSLIASKKALDLAYSIENKKLIVRACVGLGWSYNSNEHIDSAVICAKQALDLLKDTEDYNGLTQAYNLRSLLLMYYGQYTQAEEIYLAATKTAERSGIIRDRAKIANNLGILYTKMGDYEASLDQLFNCLEWSEQISDDIYIGRAYYNIGRNYKMLKSYTEAYDWLLKSINNRLEIKYYNGVAEGLYTLADMFFEMPHSDLKEGLYKRLKGDGYHGPFNLLDSAETLPTLENNVGIKHHIEEIRIKGYALEGDYKQAFERLKTYKERNDSFLLSEKNLEFIANLKMQYQNDLLESQNELKELELSRRKNIQIFLIAIATLLLGLLLFSIQYFKQKKTLHSLKHQKAIDNKLVLIDRLNDRISDLLDQTHQLELRPLIDINEILQNQLSEKEYEVLTLIAKGLTNKEIAVEQFISPNTVKFHLKNIYSKLDVNNRREAVKKIASLIN